MVRMSVIMHEGQGCLRSRHPQANEKLAQDWALRWEVNGQQGPVAKTPGCELKRTRSDLPNRFDEFWHEFLGEGDGGRRNKSQAQATHAHK